MSAPFGWTGSPSYYGAFGGAISWLLACESPSSMTGGASSDTDPFFAYEWVDDHVLVEVDTPFRLQGALEALRLAMIAVLGPRAINEEKFTTWKTEVEVLGLVFNTAQRTVSMPSSKLTKALERVVRMAQSPTVSRIKLECLLGSLCHVSSCLRAAKPFFQRVQLTAKRAPRRGRINLTPAIQKDLQWFRAILVHGHWSGLPLSLFHDLPPASVHLYMDASNDGLAVLDPANRRFIRLRVDDEERALFPAAGGTRLRHQHSRVVLCSAGRGALGSWVGSSSAEPRNPRPCMVRQCKCRFLDKKAVRRQPICPGADPCNRLQRSYSPVSPIRQSPAGVYQPHR
jgi:hypothetical protein